MCLSNCTTPVGTIIVIKVSVIIPVYNSEYHLDECLRSVLNQTLTDIEVIVVNDASSDSSPKLIEKFQNSDSRIKVLHHSVNKGLAATRNTGVSEAVGKYIIHLDSDDFWMDSNMLLNLYQTASLEGCDILRFNGYMYHQGVFEKPIIPELNLINGSMLNDDRLWNFRSVFLYFFKKTYLLENNLNFIEGINLGEDGVFLSKAISQSNKISSIKDHYYGYRIHTVSMMQKKWSIDNFLEEEQASQIIAENISHNPMALRHYLGYRIKSYWPLKLGEKLKLSCSREERISLYKEARKNFSRLNIELTDKHPFFSKKNKYLHQCFLDENYQAIDVLIMSSKNLNISLTLKKVQKFIKHHHFLNVWYKGLKTLRNTVTNFFHLTTIYKYLYPRVPSKNFNNIENLHEYDFTLLSDNKDKGISAMLRVKNEQRYIKRCIESIIDLFDEIVIIDNNSQDDTLTIIKTMAKLEKYTTKLKIYSYPHEIARCGKQHATVDANSVHSLAYFYNWCLSHCRYSMVCKWDADMLVIPEIKHQYMLRSFFKQQIENEKLSMGIFKAQTVYYDNEDDAYLAKNEINEEVRIFPNLSEVHFVKSDDWELLHSEINVKKENYAQISIYELKHTEDDEFSHWSDKRFSGDRKVIEYRNYLKVSSGIHKQRQNEFEPLKL